MTDNMMLGIDPGYDRLGWAIGSMQGRKLVVSEYGSIETDRARSIFERYDTILQNLDNLLNRFKPTELAIETLFFSSNKTTALRVSEVRGVIIGACLSKELSIHEYNPTQIKQIAAGSGRADKQMIAKMIALQTKIEVRDTLDDAIDAVAVLLTHSLLRNSQLI